MALGELRRSLRSGFTAGARNRAVGKASRRRLNKRQVQCVVSFHSLPEIEVRISDNHFPPRTSAPTRAAAEKRTLIGVTSLPLACKPEIVTENSRSGLTVFTGN